MKEIAASRNLRTIWTYLEGSRAIPAVDKLVAVGVVGKLSPRFQTVLGELLLLPRPRGSSRRRRRRRRVRRRVDPDPRGWWSHTEMCPCFI